MKTKLAVSLVVVGSVLFLSFEGWADVPAPPVDQSMGLRDVFLSDYTETECLVCHEGGIPVSGDHHSTSLALDRKCTSCHGDLVDNFDDGHYVPTYGASLVTPWPSGKPNGGSPLNSLGSSTGSCDFCHNDPSGTYTNEALHHNTGLGSDATKCAWCHDDSAAAGEKIRRCEDCHGPDSLHNIQADSPNPATAGIIVIGGEDAGYGHVGRDAGPGDSDCLGCHGFDLVDEPTNDVDRHHNLYGGTIPSPTDAPFGTPGDMYVCLSCHDNSLSVERNCSACHDLGSDSDGDGVVDLVDLCPGTGVTAVVDESGCSVAQVDVDGDGFCNIGAPSSGPDNCIPTDNCPTVPNPAQVDDNNDGFGDACVPPGSITPGADIGGNPVIGDNTTIAAGTSIGDDATIGENVIISKDSDIGDNVTVGSGSEIAKDSVIGNEVEIGSNVVIKKQVEIGDGTVIGDSCVIEKNVVIGANVTIGNNVTIKRDTVIPAGTVIPDGWTVPPLP